MKTRISAIVCLLCVVGYPLSASAGDEPPTMPSGTSELYLSFMAGVAIPFSADATFGEGNPPGMPSVVKDVDYQTKHSWGGNAGIWFPTRDKLVGFDLGLEITGYVWYPDVACCRDYYNNNPATNTGTTTEISAAYIGSNFMVRYPMAISEAYPNGRWHPYVGIGVGAHQLAMKPGGFRGGTLFAANTNQRDTTFGFQGVGGVKAHLFKYVAAFVEAKYLYADHSGLSSDRDGVSPPGIITGGPGPIVNPYASTMTTILVHAGLSLHFNWEPPDWGE